MMDTWRTLRSIVAPTPLERHLSKRGVSPGAPVPWWGLRLRVVVLDAGGIDCEGAKYPLLALRGMDASVWVTHQEAGTLQLTDSGDDTRGLCAALRFRQGEELLITATGPAAKEALEACRVMLEAPPEERKELYRKHYRRESA